LREWVNIKNEEKLAPSAGGNQGAEAELNALCSQSSILLFPSTSLFFTKSRYFEGNVV
jgi:hypothetical protein